MTAPIVAIDGPAGAGKSTVARQLARRLGFTIIDTGAIYRSVALAARRAAVGWEDDEGLRRLEIPEDMQKKYGFKPLGPADGPIKTAIFSGNSARLYGLEKHADIVRHDRFAALKADYDKNGPGRSNLRYGYVTKSA